MRWSQLKKLVEANFEEGLRLVVHCTAQRAEAGGGSIGRYWFMLNKQNIWDEPKNVSFKLREGNQDQSASVMTELFRLYLNCGRDELFLLQSPEDHWGLLDLLKAADRRIGKARLLALYEKTEIEAAKRVIAARFPEAAQYELRK